MVFRPVDPGQELHLPFPSHKKNLKITYPIKLACRNKEDWNKVRKKEEECVMIQCPDSSPKLDNQASFSNTPENKVRGGEKQKELHFRSGIYCSILKSLPVLFFICWSLL